jgi:protein-S-isoprenylcysteine O-methyltransferase Ste14
MGHHMQNAAASDHRRRSLLGGLRVLVTLAVLLFLPAGTLAYWQGWLFLVNFTACMAVVTLYFLKHDPALVERRLRVGPKAEPEKSQKVILLCAGVAVACLFLLPALDYRFGWSRAPVWVVLLGNGLVILGYVMMFVVFRENSFAASTVQVAVGQSVISSGPYALVRHPMYSGALVMFAGTPLALGSWLGLIMLVPILMVLVARLVDEERFLVRNLPGYEAYRQKVRYRLVPGLW